MALWIRVSSLKFSIWSISIIPLDFLSKFLENPKTQKFEIVFRTLKHAAMVVSASLAHKTWWETTFCLAKNSQSHSSWFCRVISKYWRNAQKLTSIRYISSNLLIVFFCWKYFQNCAITVSRVLNIFSIGLKILEVPILDFQNLQPDWKNIQTS